ncbi:MAG TPA: plastocyanin/azurin family copper-binding protein [Candidatus Udaeobacter sp.]|nr:plastocyanin/azurin family copper-binding protein [Candidatus Udaeobacter sp.]
MKQLILTVRSISWLVIFAAALPFLPAQTYAGSTKEKTAPRIVVVDASGREVPSGRPTSVSQIFDVTVGPGGAFTFSPNTVDILVGDTVRWTWGSDGHSVTGGEDCAANSEFCSPDDMNCSGFNVSPTGTVYQHTFNTAGSYSYYCVAHCFRGMVGTVNVTAPLQLTSAVSRKTHGAAGTFDVPLPLSGTPGVECRSSGGNHTLVFSFSNNVTAGSASVTAGTGSVSGSPSFSGNAMTVDLTGVTDVQQITVTLSGVTDSSAATLPDTSVSVNMLVGDTTGNKSVNASDVSQTKAQSGAAVTASNFRTDVTVNGVLNASDVSLVKSRSGSALPP